MLDLFDAVIRSSTCHGNTNTNITNIRDNVYDTVITTKSLQ